MKELTMSKMETNGEETGCEGVKLTEECRLALQKLKKKLAKRETEIGGRWASVMEREQYEEKHREKVSRFLLFV